MLPRNITAVGDLGIQVVAFVQNGNILAREHESRGACGLRYQALPRRDDLGGIRGTHHIQPGHSAQ